MKKVILLALAMFMFGGCAKINVYFAENKVTVCESFKNVQCPKGFVELEASDVYAPAGILSERIKSCIRYSKNDSISEFPDFKCKSFFE